MMIFKSLCLQKPLHLYFWNHKNLGHVMPAGDVGAVRPVGAILPTATAAGPSHSRSHGRLRRSDVPCRPVMFRWWIFRCLAMPIWHWPEQINGKWYRVKLLCLSKNGTSLARQTTRNRGVVYVIGTKPFIFDPLGNGNLALRINYQKVIRLNESQEVASKWGLGRSP